MDNLSSVREWQERCLHSGSVEETKRILHKNGWNDAVGSKIKQAICEEVHSHLRRALEHSSCERLCEIDVSELQSLLDEADKLFL